MNFNSRFESTLEASTVFFCLSSSDPSDGDPSLFRTLPLVVYWSGRSIADSRRRTWVLPTCAAAHPPPTEPEVLAAYLSGETESMFLCSGSDFDPDLWFF